MLPPEYLSTVAEPLVAIFSELQIRIQADIARRIAESGELTATAQWQAIKMRQLGMAQGDMQREIAKALGISEREVARLFRAAGLKSMQSDKALQRELIKAGRLPKGVAPLGASEAFKQVMTANAKRTMNTLRRLTGTIAIDGTGKLNQYMDMAQMMTQSGAFTHEQSIQAAVERFANDGVYAFDYFSGVRTSIEAAVRRALVTGVNQATAEISLSNAEELGTDLVEVTSHRDARPAHAAWQGGIYSISGNHPKYKKLADATGYGTVTGLCGANCRHSFYAFVEGISEQLPKEEYSQETYEQEQESRYNERQIRKYKRQAATLEAGGQDAAKAKGKAAYWQARQNEHIQKTGLTREYARERIYNASGMVRVNTSGIASRAEKMYNTGTSSGNIAAYLRDQPIREKIRSDATIKTIHEGKQNGHIPGTNEYKQYVEKLRRRNQYGPSRLTVDIAEVRQLVERYHGTGVLGRRKDGTWNSVEEITVHPDKVGITVNNLTGKEAETTVFKIHYGKNGAHIVPGYPSRKGEKSTK